MTKVILTSVARYTTNKEGQPLMGKNGKPYSSIRIKTNVHGDKLLSGFGNKDNALWNVEDEVEIIVTENGQYLNFDTPKVADKLDAKYEELANKITGLTLRINAIEAHLKPKPKEAIGEMPEYPVEEWPVGDEASPL